MTRCLIVDDSPTFRAVLKSILAPLPDVTVVGEAADGAEAVARALELRPDVMTMDVRMPKQDGFAAIREIMVRCPTPIIVICAEANDESLGIGFKSLEVGAIDVLGKPDASRPERFSLQAEAIRAAVRVVGRVKLSGAQAADRAVPRSQRKSAVPPRRMDCLGIVASTGGPRALQEIFGALPGSFPIPVVVAQHVADGFLPGMIKWLQDFSELELRLATDGARLEPGVVHFAPGRQHLSVSMGCCRLDNGAPVRGARPSGTILLASLAKEYGARGGGLVLTGMGDDGAAGIRALRDVGGVGMAQGPRSSVVFGMPKAAVELGGAEYVLELEEMASFLGQLAESGGARLADSSGRSSYVRPEAGEVDR